MMRTLVAILAASPALVFAQTNQPAQPRSTPVLHSTLVQPAMLHAAVVAERSDKSSPLRVSTGVVAPRVIRTVPLVAAEDSSLSKHVTRSEQKVTVDMTVDESGKPKNLSVSKSAGFVIDQQVLSTISQYRYQPGTLDGQPTAIPVKLEVTIPAEITY